MTFKEVWAYRGVRFVALGWAGFITENLVLSENRERIIDAFGDQSYHIFYSALSTAACASMGYGYFKFGRKNQGPRMPGWPGHIAAFRGLGVGLQVMGGVAMTQSLPKLQIPFGPKDDVPPPTLANVNQTTEAPQQPKSSGKWVLKCPIDFKAKSDKEGVHGMQRVCRQPGLWALGVVGLGTAMRSTSATTVTMFTLPIIFSAIGSAHKDSRHRRGHGDGKLTPELAAQTSWLPFGAVVTGQQHLSDIWNELKGVNASLAVAAVGMSLVM